jgi:hypothetical protein
MKKLIVFFTMCLSVSAWSNVIVDVYGVDPKTASHIQQKYASRVRAIEGKIMSEFLRDISDSSNFKKNEAITKKKINLIKDIQKSGHFLFVDLQTINYSDEDNIYTTIEVIRAEEPERLKFITKKTSIKDTLNQQDIFDKMLEYQLISTKLILTKKIDSKDESCPVFHCTSPFTHPELTPYLALFNNAALNQKDTIINTLRSDPNPERRVAAAYLIGHFKNPKEIISVLSPQIYDEDHSVRNSVMRVMGATLSKADTGAINITPFLNLLDSPYVTDRNKSLYILYSLLKLESVKKQIIQQGTQQLIAILRLKQPNNHGFAYAILQIISNKNLDDTDIKGWEKWAKETSLDKKSSKI